MNFLLPKSTTPWLPIAGTGIDAAPFLALFALLLIASLILQHHRHAPARARFLIRLCSSVLFIFVVFFSHCFLKLATFSLSRIGWDDLLAFNDLYRLVIPIGFTLLVGPVFCGWVCPFGLLQEITSKLFAARTKRGQLICLGLIGAGAIAYVFRFHSATDRLAENVPTIWTIALLAILTLVVLKPQLESALLKIRYVSLGLFTLLAAFLVFNEGWCVLYINEVDHAALLACLVILASTIVVPFGWCRYLCPTGALFSWIGKASLLGGQRRCTPACHLSKSCERACRLADLSLISQPAPARLAVAAGR